MQIKYLHKNIYKLANYALSQEKCDQQRKNYEEPVRKWCKLKLEGVPDQTCQAILGISRATFFRYKNKLKMLEKGIALPSKRPRNMRKPLWGETEKQLVLRLRRENPTYGKFKISIIIRRDHGLNISQTTTGRIIRHLMDKGLIQKSLSAPGMKRKRRFKGHAQPWEYNKKPAKPGEMVQIDHMTVTKNVLYSKHFQAWDKKSKFIHANLYSDAKSSAAKKFLLELLEIAPFTITSIQVDGGSEFMKDFEEACHELGIVLYVLPPRRPQYNGGVERGNRIFREEFYARKDLLADSIGAMRAELKAALHKYNNYRPHFNLKGQTPMQYIKSYLSAAA